MKPNFIQETFVEQKLTYTLEFDGKFFIIENVPARVCQETGESFFFSETVERIQEIIWQNKSPKRVIETFMNLVLLDNPLIHREAKCDKLLYYIAFLVSMRYKISVMDSRFRGNDSFSEVPHMFNNCYSNINR